MKPLQFLIGPQRHKSCLFHASPLHSVFSPKLYTSKLIIDVSHSIQRPTRMARARSRGLWKGVQGRLLGEIIFLVWAILFSNDFYVAKGTEVAIKQFLDISQIPNFDLKK